MRSNAGVGNNNRSRLFLVWAAACGLFLALSTTTTTTAFIVGPSSVRRLPRPPLLFFLAHDPSSGPQQSDNAPKATEVAAPQEQLPEEPAMEAVEEEEAAAAPLPPQDEEDPELTRLKRDIAELENTLKTRRRTVSELSDKADDFTQSGYARKVAEMENMRRARSMLNSSNKYTATAAVLTEFVPILDRLEGLKLQFADDEFGQQYGALAGSLKAALTELGVAELVVTMGQAFDKKRMQKVAERHSELVPAQTVLEVLANGLELSGNVVRPARVVVSMGPEPLLPSAPEDAAAEGEEEEASPATLDE